jgi:chitin disaccharide deacetylase
MKLVVNADDFGFTKAVNEGIVEGFRKGIVSSASILANYDLKHLPEVKKLGLGVHLNATFGNSLFDKKPFPKKMWTRAFMIKTNGSFIEKEFKKQIETLQDLGYKLDHINTHQHIHVIPPVTKIVYDLAREFKIKYVRYPKENIEKTTFEAKIVDFHLKKFPKDLKCADNFFGLAHTGNPSLENYYSYLDFKGSAEIMCHPGKSSGDSSKLSKVRSKELKILQNKGLIEEIKKRKIRLVRCKDLW